MQKYIGEIKINVFQMSVFEDTSLTMYISRYGLYMSIRYSSTNKPCYKKYKVYLERIYITNLCGIFPVPEHLRIIFASNIPKFWSDIYDMIFS